MLSQLAAKWGMVYKSCFLLTKVGPIMSAQQNWVVGLVMRRGGAEAHDRRVKKNWMEVCQRHYEHQGRSAAHPQAIRHPPEQSSVYLTAFIGGGN